MAEFVRGRLLVIWALAVCGIGWVASAQDEDPLARFVSETGIPLETRTEAIKDYLLGRIPPLEAGLEDRLSALRVRYRDDLVLRGVPDAWRRHSVQVEWAGDIETEHGYRIRKLRYEALPGLWIPALLYEPDEVIGKIPAVLNVNGHVGAPGKASAYEQIRCINLAKRGMLALHPEWFACGELGSPDYAHSKLAYLDLVGVSGLSVFHYALERALDVLLADARADSSRVAMTGLSGGGWQTTVFSAIDERVKVIVPNAGHSGFALRLHGLRNMGDLEQAPVDLLTIGDYSHVTALFAPRPALLIYNAADDCCFTAAEALPTVYDPVLPVYRALGRGDDFRFYINEEPGTHNYELDNRIQFYNFIEEYFFEEEKRFSGEIASDDEVLSFDALAVGLPEDNATFRSLALEVASEFEWTGARSNAALRRVVRYETLRVTGEIVATEELDGLRASAVHFGTSLGPFYGLMLETPDAGAGAAMYVGDESIALDTIRALAKSQGRVLAIAPLFLGGDAVAWQYAMALEASGRRALGVQAAEILGARDWLAGTPDARAISLHASGPKSSMAGKVAVALSEGRFTAATFDGDYDDVLIPVKESWDWSRNQSLFCFGLATVWGEE